MRASRCLAIIVVLAPTAVFLWFVFRALPSIESLLESVPWGLTLLAWSILIGVLGNLDKASSIVASFYKALSGISFWFEEKAVRKRLEATIGSASKKLNDEGVALLSHGISVRWVEATNREAFLREGRVVVCLEPSQNEARNLAMATILYVSDDLIRESQRFVDHTVMKCVSFAVARKMLMIDRRLDAMKLLNEEHIEPAASQIPEIRKYLPAMEKLDSQGFLTRVLLREFSQLGAKLSPMTSDPRSQSETKAFTHLLKDLVEKEKEEDVPLRLRGEVIRVGLAPIARSSAEFNMATYSRSANRSYRDGIETVYVLAAGYNIKLAKLVVRTMERKGLYRKQKEWQYNAFHGRDRVETYVAATIRVSPSIKAFEKLREIVMAMHEGNEYTGLEAVVGRMRDVGINYQDLGFGKFGDLVRAAEQEGYVDLVLQADSKYIIEPR